MQGAHGKRIEEHFNCTIQELKLSSDSSTNRVNTFQLHHTGIKTQEASDAAVDFFKFQLHHTGIKTNKYDNDLTFRKRFQLHHTGIKTLSIDIKRLRVNSISIAPYRN